jgi:hypothetical protein
MSQITANFLACGWWQGGGDLESEGCGAVAVVEAYPWIHARVAPQFDGD